MRSIAHARRLQSETEGIPSRLVEIVEEQQARIEYLERVVRLLLEERAAGE